MTARRARSALRAAALLALVPSVIGTAALPAAAVETSGAQPTEWCIPIIMPCHSSPSPTPSPSPSASASVPGIPSLPTVPGLPEPGQPSPSPSPSEGTTPPAVAPIADEQGPVFTQPSAQLGSKSLSFSGLRGISVVTVPLADGSRTTALKLEADRITISGFSLTVRRDTGPILTTTADTMTLDGHVAVYINSLSATLPGGKLLTLGADTPPPAEGLDSMFGVTLGLVGSTADAITYTNTVQHLSE
ncbi:hypothetical protein HMPREF1529_01095 [Microbacterium sp. oral taxon 186 str. F0373]|uniref:hypothetical protein n=1 Tax=Microbacterium sp. oral taxon 186 TaxID=712383 RepID=UPI00034EBC5B|nr:hypothetical protein [Microbacterium sp. oral taxon 186]EPD84492.1 hypothetical protein HMPREF1529_01095 [Microbacterium sp. oral taxon 186 str. F0373]